MKMRGQMPDVIVPPPPMPPVRPPEDPERDDPAEPGETEDGPDWSDWSDDELPPVINSTEDEDIPWAALHLWRDEAGELRVAVYDGNRVFQLVPEAEEYARLPGWYDFDWKPSRDPCG